MLYKSKVSALQKQSELDSICTGLEKSWLACYQLWLARLAIKLQFHAHSLQLWVVNCTACPKATNGLLNVFIAFTEVPYSPQAILSD